MSRAKRLERFLRVRDVTGERLAKLEETLAEARAEAETLWGKVAARQTAENPPEPTATPEEAHAMRLAVATVALIETRAARERRILEGLEPAIKRLTSRESGPRVSEQEEA